MRAHRDPDLVLVESMLAPPPLDEARSSLAYWQTRLKTLPLHRRRARREAREMVTRWESRVLAAEQVRFASTRLGRWMTALGISTAWVPQLRKHGVLRFAWVLIPRRIKLVFGAVAAAWLITTAVIVAAAVAVCIQLA